MNAQKKEWGIALQTAKEAVTKTNARIQHWFTAEDKVETHSCQTQYNNAQIFFIFLTFSFIE